jgi:hypothetical protein
MPTASAPKPTQDGHGQIVAPGEIAERHPPAEGRDEAAAAQPQGDQVGQQRPHKGQDLPPLPFQPPAIIGHAEQQAHERADPEAGGQAPADLLGHVAHNGSGEVARQLGQREVDRDQEERHAEAVVEPAFDVQRLAHSGRH